MTASNFSNNMKTAALMGALIALFGATGYFVTGDALGLVGFGMIAVIMNVGAWFFSDTIAIKSMRGQPVDPEDTRLINGGSVSQADLHRMTADMAEDAGLPMPRLYICPHQAPNAFATGRSPKKSAVAVTAGLCQYMDREEIRGVIAHELAHIKNRDTTISMIAATIAGVLAILAQWGFLLGMGRGRGGNPIVVLIVLILAAVGAALIQMAISRSREFAADREGAKIAGTPRGLRSALLKLEQLASRIPLQQPNPAQNNLFIVEPLSPGGKTLANLFATHPAVEKRVEKLDQLEQLM